MKFETICSKLNELSKNTNTGVIEGNLVVGNVIAKYKIIFAIMINKRFYYFVANIKKAHALTKT